VTSLVERAFKLHQLGDALGAKLHYLAELESDPNSLPALMNLSQLAIDAGQHATAKVLLKRAIALDPNSTILWGNLGMLCAQQELFEEAEEALTKALNLGPEVTSNWRNAGLLRIRMRQYSEAVDCFHRCQRLGDNGHGLRNDLAHALLALGDLKPALELYESRWAVLNHHECWDHHIPEWKGEDLTDKRVLVSAEQGFGDTIMTLRFISDLMVKYPKASITLCVPPELVALCEAVLAVKVIDFASSGPDYDYHTPLMSMVRWLEIEVGDIRSEPYIYLVDETVKNVYRVGICWASGRRNSDHDWRGRYTSLNDWLPLATVPSVQLVSLQQGDDGNDVVRIGAEPLIEDRQIALSKDWLDTAMVVASLDLVITVDTAVAHLAGAMGKPVIMLSQYSNCWRWWNIDSGSGEPWYKHMNIIQQESPKDWKSCLSRAKDLLEDMVL
jgi:hypothetical protein